MSEFDPFAVPAPLSPAFSARLPVNELADLIEAELRTSRTFQLWELTVRLAAIDRVARNEAALLRGRQATLLEQPARLAQLLRIERLADTLRFRRRELAISVALERGRDFTEEVVRPLLARSWLPAAAYEPALTAATKANPWRRMTFGRGRPGAGRSAIESVAANLASETDPIARASAAYILAIEKLAIARRHALTIPSAEILLAPAGREWPVGHILRADLLPLPASAPLTPFEEDSLTPAQLAAEHSAPPLAGHRWGIGIGDLPGGTDDACQFDGPSAGLALALMFLNAQSRGTYATARIDAFGNVFPLDNGSIAPKTAAVALAHRFEGIVPSLLVGGESDAQAAIKAAATLGLPLGVMTVTSLAEAQSSTAAVPLSAGV